MSQVSVCMNCNDRELGCHGTCTKYIAESILKGNTERQRQAKVKEYQQKEKRNTGARRSPVAGGSGFWKRGYVR